jgi:methylmalonyl-CoA mutase, N-terminal domain
VNADTVVGPLEILRVSHEVEIEQNRILAERRASRNEAAVTEALQAMLEVARGAGNLVPSMLEAARREATLGEICGVLREEWGDYSEPARF